MSSAIQVTLDGVEVRARLQASSIKKLLGPSPNTARFSFDETVTAGQQVRVALIDESPERVLFAGEVQKAAEAYDGSVSNERWDADLIDNSYKANRRRPFGTWTDTSGTTIALYIAALYAPECTTDAVEAGLPNVSITFDGSQPFMACWQALANAIPGARGLITDLNDLALYVTDPYPAPDPLDDDHPPLDVPQIRFTTDLAQVRTRIYGKGVSVGILADLDVRETIVPVQDVAAFSPTGAQAIAGTIQGGAQSQIIDYSGIDEGLGGSLVGPGAQPASAPTLTRASGTGLGLGTYQYAITFITAAGESLPSPLGSIVTKVIPTPGSLTDLGVVTSPPGTYFSAGTIGNVGDSVRYRATYTYASSASDYTQESAGGTVLSSTLVACPNGSPPPGAVGVPLIRIPYSSDPAVTWVRLWWINDTRGDSVFTQMPLIVDANNVSIPGQSSGSIPNVVGSGSIDIMRDRIQTGNIPSSNANFKQVALSGIAIGPTGTTQRKVYRTVVDGSQLKLQQTIANNTATTGTQDSTADGSLGANAPSSDTSGLTQPSGQVNAGATTVPTASPAPFRSGGGWALLPAGQAVRYTAISGNTLTGVPASGPGSIQTTVLYGAQIIPAPSLIGVNASHSPEGLSVAIAKGSTIAIWIQSDDTAAQAALAALEGGDGIREDTLFDGRLGYELLAATVAARLTAFSRPIVSLAYATLDVKTRPGATISVNLTSAPGAGGFDPAVFDDRVFDMDWGVAADYTIQDVAISFYGPHQRPKYVVNASSVAFTLMDLLRLAQIFN